MYSRMCGSNPTWRAKDQGERSTRILNLSNKNTEKRSFSVCFHLNRFIWGGGEVGESRRTVNPFLIGEWVRIPPSRPERNAQTKTNTMRCEYRRGSFHLSQNPRRVKRGDCSYGWRSLVVFELNKALHLVTVVKRYIPTRAETYQIFSSTLHMR